MGAESALAGGVEEAVVVEEENSKDQEPNSKQEASGQKADEQKETKETKADEVAEEKAEEQKEAKRDEERPEADLNAVTPALTEGEREKVVRAEHPEGEGFFRGSVEEMSDAEAEEIARGQLARSGLLRGQRVRV